MVSIRSLAKSFALQQAAEGKSPKTIRTYGDAIARLADVAEDDLSVCTKRLIADHLAGLLATHKPASVSVYYRSLRVFFNWLVEDGELERNPMDGIKPPKVRVTAPAVYSDDELRRLIESCTGSTFRDRRDAALVRFLAETGCRRGEVIGMKVSDVVLGDERIAYVSGKTGPRWVPFGQKTYLALLAYLRARERQPFATKTDALWLGPKGPLTGQGLLQVVNYRLGLAGIDHGNVHLFRHSAANTWLANGGSEGDAMTIFGWSSRSMLDRYGASQRQTRAIASARRLSIGDRL